MCNDNNYSSDSGKCGVDFSELPDVHFLIMSHQRHVVLATFLIVVNTQKARPNLTQAPSISQLTGNLHLLC